MQCKAPDAPQCEHARRAPASSGQRCSAPATASKIAELISARALRFRDLLKAGKTLPDQDIYDGTFGSGDGTKDDE